MLRLGLTAHAPTTNAAYAGDLMRFAEYLDLDTPAAAIAALLAAGRPRAVAIMQEYKAAMRRRLAAATINRRLSAVRSCFVRAKRERLVAWEIHVDLLIAVAYRDTRGPGRDNYKKMLRWARAQGGPRADRDVAILRLLYDRGLRNGEVITLNAGDLLWDDPPGHVRIVGKGRTQPEILELAKETAQALHRHAVGTDAAGAERPLFGHNSRAHAAGRITDDGLAHLVGQIGRKVGCRCTPHGLRHSAITDLINMGKTLPEVQVFSRHKDLRTLQKYYDAARATGGDMTSALAMGTESPWIA